jgi:hypothetical protein
MSFGFSLHVMQMVAGLFQSATGWPLVVAVIGSWCGLI